MKNRNATIDFLKFIFACVIVIFHGRNITLNGETSIFPGGYR